jgi:hypothetical protein
VIIRAEKLPNKELFMMRRWIALVCLIMLGTTAQAQVVCKASPNKITVEINGQPFTTFHYGNDWPKPFLHPLRTASSVVVTRGFPLETNAGESDELNSDGLKGTKYIWGKRARWVDISTMINNQAVGVAIFDHPSNPKHPTFWHARGYGLNAANPFGEHDFYNDKARDGSITIPANGKLTFRYRIVIHNGAAATSNVEQLYAMFAKMC